MKSQSESQDTLISFIPEEKCRDREIDVHRRRERLYKRLGIEIHIHRQRESKTEREGVWQK